MLLMRRIQKEVSDKDFSRKAFSPTIDEDETNSTLEPGNLNRHTQGWIWTPGITPSSRPLPEQVFMDDDQDGIRPRRKAVWLLRSSVSSKRGTHSPYYFSFYPLQLEECLEDAYTIGDQILNDKSTEDEPGKLNVKAEVVFMVTVPIYQAFSSVPPLSTPVIDLSPPKPVSSSTQAPIFTTTTTTTTLLLPPPPQQQSTTDLELVARVTALEQKFSAFEQKSKSLGNPT
ncbi:hypothetical protein Tco_0162717 [Tanacetum coccineum]